MRRARFGFLPLLLLCGCGGITAEGRPDERDAVTTDVADVAAIDSEAATDSADAGSIWGKCRPRRWVTSTASLVDHSERTLRTLPPTAEELFNTDSALLPDGTVLLGGGEGIYDPKTDAFEFLPRIEGASYTWGTSAIGLSDGHSVLLTGSGRAHILDLPTRTWRNVGPSKRPHAFHGSHLLPDGTVLVLAGPEDYPTSEVYDPAANTWTEYPLPDEFLTLFADGRPVEKSIQLLGGDVLLLGRGGGTLLFDASARRWRYLHPTAPGVSQSLVRLADGRVLSRCRCGDPNKTSVFDPISETWSSAFPGKDGIASEGRADSDRAFLLPCGKVLYYGADQTVLPPSVTGSIAARPLLLDPQTGEWTAPQGHSPYALQHHSAPLLLPDGTVMIAWGYMPEGPYGWHIQLYREED